jgi:ABC-type multidrug transport system permease subunit
MKKQTTRNFHGKSQIKNEGSKRYWKQDDTMLMRDLIRNGKVTQDTTVKDIMESNDPDFKIFQETFSRGVLQNHLNKVKEKFGLQLISVGSEKGIQYFLNYFISKIILILIDCIIIFILFLLLYFFFAFFIFTMPITVRICSQHG